MNLRTGLVLLILVTALSVGVAGALWSSARTHDILSQELEERAVSLGTALAETLISHVVERDKVGVIHALRRLIKASKDIAYLYVTDFDGNLFGHGFEGGFPQQLQLQTGPASLAGGPLVRETRFRGTDVLEVTLPLIGGLGAHITIGLDTTYIHEQLLEDRILMFSAALGVGVLVSILGIWLGTRMVAPITLLARQMSNYGRGQSVALGDLVQRSSTRETQLLTHTFLDMMHERERSEAELNQIKTSLDNTEDAVFMFYPDSLAFFYVNRGAQTQVGYTQRELLTMTPVDIKPTHDEASFRKLIGPLLSGDQDSATFETIHRHKDGTDIPVEIFLQFMTSSEPPHFLAIVRDITERKRAEERLQELNQQLEQRVQARTAELADSNDQLRDTLRTLQQAQTELVRSEKLASLGSLVAGVAHELNTPLGNSVTVSTTLQEWLNEFRKEVDSGTLRRSNLDNFMSQADEAIHLLVRNLHRAAELIGDFKQVAVDQTSEQRRDFDLRQAVHEVVETLQPQFKKTPHTVQVDIPEDILMDSFPGPLGQVITNLTLNALLHGFSPDQPGQVRVGAQLLADDNVELVVSDNGSGIEADHLAKVFDPFFTTKMGKGGSGLGLHIVYTLVTRVLGGSIQAGHSDDGGARLIIRMPRVAPQKDADNEPG